MSASEGRSSPRRCASNVPGVSIITSFHAGEHIRADHDEALVVVAAGKDGRPVMPTRSFGRDETGWPVLGRIFGRSFVAAEWLLVVEALNGISMNSAFRRY
jgi:hypothetical protein